MLITSLFLFGCDSDDDDDDYVANIENLVVINAIPDSPVLTVTLGVTDGADGEVDDVTAILDYQAASSFDVDILDVVMAVTYFDPVSDSTRTIFNDVAIPMSVDTLHTVVLTGSFAAPDYSVLTREEGDIEDSDDEAELLLVNLTSIEPATFEFLGASDGGVVSRSVSSGQAADVFRISTDQSYEVSVTDINSTRVEAGTVTFSATNRRTLFLVENEGGDHPKLFQAAGSGITEFKNLVEPPRLRIMNGVIDRPDLTFTISDSFSGDVQNVVDLSFPSASAYVTTSLDSVFLDVTHNDGVAEFTNIVSLDEDSVYSVVVAGTHSDSEVRLVEEDGRLVATKTNVAMVNAAHIVVNAGTDDEDTLELDIYLLQDGESLEDVAPQAQGLDFLEADSVSLPALPTVLVATEFGTNNIVAGPSPVILSEKSSVLITVVETFGGGLPLQFAVGQ